MNVFELRNHLIEDYSSYISSFIQIQDQRIRSYVAQRLESSLLWLESLIQLNPAFAPSHWVDELVDEGLLYRACRSIFRQKSDDSTGNRFHKHQEDAIRIAQQSMNYLLITLTRSSKSLAYFVPIADYALTHGSGKGIGDTVYSSLETKDERYITVNGQKFVPNDRSRILVPLVFCRECSQEHYTIRKFRG